MAVIVGSFPQASKQIYKQRTKHRNKQKLLCTAPPQCNEKNLVKSSSISAKTLKTMKC